MTLETRTAELLKTWIGSAMTADSAVMDDLIEVLAAPLAEVEDVVRGWADLGPGWSTALDPTAAPDALVDWIAMFAGVRLADNLSVGGKRAALLARPSTRVGTAEAVRNSASPWLSSGDVTVTERYTGDEHRIEVSYTAAQVAGVTYSALAASNATYADLAARYSRYGDFDGNADELQEAVLAVVPADIITTFTEV